MCRCTHRVCICSVKCSDRDCLAGFVAALSTRARIVTRDGVQKAYMVAIECRLLNKLKILIGEDLGRSDRGAEECGEA